MPSKDPAEAVCHTGGVSGAADRGRVFGDAFRLSDGPASDRGLRRPRVAVGARHWRTVKIYAE